MKLVASLPINRVPFILMIATTLSDLDDLKVNRAFFVDQDGNPTGATAERQWGDVHRFDVLMYVPLRVSRVHDRLIEKDAKGNAADISEVFRQCDSDVQIIRDGLIRHFKLNEVAEPEGEGEKQKDPAILKAVEALPIMVNAALIQARVELYRHAFKWLEDMEFNSPEWGKLSISMIKAHTVLTAKSDNREGYAKAVASELELNLI